MLVGVIPAELTSFVGRRRELAVVKRALADARLVTLTGAGGVGKTRLALRIAHERRRAFPDGLWFVELSGLADGELLASTVASAVGLTERSSRPPLESLVDYLADKQLLLILDTCEHLLSPCANLVSAVLRRASGVKILVTCRGVLDVAGEHVVVVPPLSVPDPAVTSEQEIADCEAVRLFADRAAVTAPDFAISADNNAAVVEICRRLDGIPLAIELAVTQLLGLTVRQLASRLEDRFGLVTSWRQGFPARQQTLRAAIDWSFDLCSPREQALWARLSVFAGGCDLGGAEAVCHEEEADRYEVLKLINALLDKSILFREEHGSQTRYRMLDTIREYGMQRLAESGQETMLRRRHRDWVQGLAAQADAELFGPRQGRWLIQLVTEQANLRAALEFCVAEPHEVTAALRILKQTLFFWFVIGLPGEGRYWIERALERVQQPGLTRAWAMWAATHLACLQGDPDAPRLLRDYHNLAEQLDEDSILTGAVYLSGMIALWQKGDFAQAAPLLRQATEGHRAHHDTVQAWLALLNWAMGAALTDDASAEPLSEELLVMTRDSGAEFFLEFALWTACVAQFRLGNLTRATALISEAMQHCHNLKDRWGTPWVMEVLAWVTSATQPGPRAALLLGAAHTLWRRTGVSLPDLGILISSHNLAEAQLRKSLGEPGFDESFREGQHLTYEQALDLALTKSQSALSAAPSQKSTDRPSPLTRREVQVAELIAEGLSNKDIAARLVVAPRTAEAHVEHILVKLNFTSRTQIVRWILDSRSA
ncbi:ATP-binding protein [Saccharopolyspora pogona]|uniref:ATP-binding protein n=1 Tax=Saccharopolyspora pogona TaxID=333966 RepID=UPI001CC263D2|nr:LuxR C-terminal-related transcriptional regulator [Saccharopolyspora pogona]